MAITITKSELQDRMFEVFREIEASDEELIVADHGKPVLKIIPLHPKVTVEALFSEFQGQVVYVEDIDTPTNFF